MSMAGVEMEVGKRTGSSPTAPGTVLATMLLTPVDGYLPAVDQVANLDVYAYWRDFGTAGECPA
jgi:hypothetical protein